MTQQREMESLPASQKKMTKQLTGKLDDTPLHTACRAGNLDAVKKIIAGTSEENLAELLSKQNLAGETALYVASEYGYVELVKEMIMYYDLESAEIKAKNGFDALHIAARQGDLDIIKVLMEGHPELSMTVDMSNSTVLHTAAAQGHVNVVDYFLETVSNLASISRNNGKTALHSAARNGHVQVLKSLLSTEFGNIIRTDKKGQTALHMAVKGENLEVVNTLIKDPSWLNVVDNKGNTPLHIATRKGKIKIVKLLLEQRDTNTRMVNKSDETALDTAKKTSQTEIAALLQQYGVKSATSSRIQPTNSARELKQTVSDIKHDVHSQLEQTRQTKRRVRGMAKHLNKLHIEGLNNAINSTTVVAVLIATVAFAAIFTVPGQYVDDVDAIPPGHSLGEANIAPNKAFLVFFIFDSVSLFISLAVVVVQTSVVIIESTAKKQMMSIINKLMWAACVFISIAFLALCYIVVGKHEQWLAIGVTVIGGSILLTTLLIMVYWIIVGRSKSKSFRRDSRCSGSKSWTMSPLSDSEILQNDFKKMYAI